MRVLSAYANELTIRRRFAEIFFLPNLADPQAAVLEPGLDGGSWFLPIFGGVFLVVGVEVFFLLMRMGQFMAEPL